MKTRFLLLAALAFLPACGSSVRTLRVTAQGGLAAASIEVDVLPDSPGAQSVPISQYFLPGNAVRAGSNPKVVRFGAGQPATQDVSVGGLGKRAVVIAQLPGAHADAPGDSDARRKTIPLSGKLPSGAKLTDVINVKVSQGGITVEPSN